MGERNVRNGIAAYVKDSSIQKFVCDHSIDLKPFDQLFLMKMKCADRNMQEDDREEQG